jgi:hypothetical protein
MMGNILDKTDKSQAPTPVGTTTEKESKYRWARPSEMGQFKLILKNDLNLEGSYQRDSVSNFRVIEIARHFDWRRFGVLLVIRRKDGTLWVIDGGHRLRATFYRSEISQLPCLVFDSSEEGEAALREEARMFLDTNQMPIHINSYSSHKAGVTAEDDADIIAAKIYNKHHYRLKRYGFVQGEKVFNAIGALKWTVTIDPDLADRSFALTTEIAQGERIPGEIIKGLFVLAQRLKDKADILEDPYAGILKAVGIGGMLRSIESEKYDSGKQGTLAAARGILRLLNKRRRNKLGWNTDSSEE